MTNTNKRIQNWIAELTKTLSNFQESEVKFTEYIVGDMTISAESLEEGSEIFQVVDGVNQPLSDGDYTIEDKVYSVKEGKITSISDAVAQVEVEQAVTEAPVDAPVDETPEDEKKETDDVDAIKKEVEDLKAEIASIKESIASLMSDQTKLKSDFSDLPSVLSKETKIVEMTNKSNIENIIEMARKKQNNLK